MTMQVTEAILNRLERNIDSYCVGELKLPDIEMAILTKCSNPFCLGMWHLASEEILLKMRSLPRKDTEELEALRCSVSDSKTTCTDRINTALEHGYLCRYQKSRPNKEEILNLIWLGLPKHPGSTDPIKNDRWLLDVAVVHGLVSIHDW